MSGKRIKEAYTTFDKNDTFDLEKAVDIILSAPQAKFDETVEIAVQLGLDVRKSDQQIRIPVVLPHGTGKKVSVAVFATGDSAEHAKAAGAEHVGMEELADQFKNNEVAVDVVIASSSAMKIVGKLGPVLGPKGLMPNPKDGTVTPDVANAVKEAKAGRVRCRASAGGVVHCPVGKRSFSPDKIVENIKFVIQSLKKAKPSGAKGTYFMSMYLSTTMGPGVRTDIGAVAAKL